MKDLGGNVYMVDGNQGSIPNLLPAEEVQRIAALQRAPFGTSFYGVASPVSPDDQTVLVRTSVIDLIFLNVRAGSMVLVWFERAILPLANVIWTDANTVSTVAVAALDGKPTIATVSFDRRTGAVRVGGDGQGAELPCGLPVPAKMLKFQDADHGFLRNTPPELSQAYKLYGAQEQIIWFRTHLE